MDGDAVERSEPRRHPGHGAKYVPGDLYVADSSAIGGSAIYRVNTKNGTTTLVHQGNPFSSIRGIAFGPNGSLFAADFGDSTVDELNLKTGAATRFSQPTTSLYRPWGIAYGGRGGDSFIVRQRRHPQRGGPGRPRDRRGEEVPQRRALSEPHGLSVALNLTPFVADFGSAGIYRLSSSVIAFKEGPFNQLQDVAVGLGPKGYRFFTSDSAGGSTPGKSRTRDCSGRRRSRSPCSSAHPLDSDRAGPEPRWQDPLHRLRGPRRAGPDRRARPCLAQSQSARQRLPDAGRARRYAAQNGEPESGRGLGGTSASPVASRPR